MLSTIAPFMRRPSSRRFSVTKAMPLRMLSRGECPVDRSIADGDLAGIVAFETEENARELRSSRAHQAEDAEHFSAVQAEGHVLDDAGRGERLGRKKDARLRRGVPRRVELLDRPADHQGDHARDVEVGLRAGGDQLAVAQHGDIVGKLDHVRQNVGDVDHRLAGRAQSSDQREEALGLPRRERGRRLVEDDDLGVELERARRPRPVGARRAKGGRAGYPVRDPGSPAGAARGSAPRGLRGRSAKADRRDGGESPSRKTFSAIVRLVKRLSS